MNTRPPSIDLCRRMDPGDEQTWIDGRYLLIERLGAGNMGAVYLGHDQKTRGRLPLGPKVVIKVPHERLLLTVGAGPFLREIESLARLQLAGVVAIRDHGRLVVDGGEFGSLELPWFVLDHLAGGSLDRRAPQSLDEALGWLRDVARILDRMHATEDAGGRGFLHRDIKPANILFDDLDRACVADFGTVKATQSTLQGTMATLPGYLPAGTPPYMAPEAAARNVPLGPAYDQYALAVTLWTMLASRSGSWEYPFEYEPRDDEGEHVWEHLDSKALHLPRELESLGLPHATRLDEVFRKALASAPSERFESCAAFTQAIVACRGGAVSHPSPPSMASTITVRSPAAAPRAKVASLQIEGLTVLRTNAETGLEEYQHEQTGVELVLIPAGKFTMGSPDSETNHQPDEVQHEVTLSRFLLAKYELTQEQWDRLRSQHAALHAPDWEFPGAKRPAENISWDDCKAWFEKTEPKLWFPTEAQWEYACRAGTTTPFSTGANITTDQANYDGNYPYANFPKGEYREQTTEVGTFDANPWGLYDMHGNVYEWCEDWYGDYDTSSKVDPRVLTNPGSGYRVSRGGSLRDLARNLRSANRHGLTPAVRYGHVGVRPAMFIPE